MSKLHMHDKLIIDLSSSGVIKNYQSSNTLYPRNIGIKSINSDRNHHVSQ